MRRFGLLVFAAACGAIPEAWAQSLGSLRTEDAFAAADSDTKRAVLRDLILRQSPWQPAEVRAVVEAGLNDESPAMRIGVLAAILSRVGPMAMALPGATSQIRAEDFTTLAPLRPRVAEVLANDPEARVRREALRAFVVLDPGNQAMPPAPAPSQETIDVLLARFRDDLDGGVRSLAITVLAPIPAPSDAVIRAFIDALSDSHPAVRNAATAGVSRLERSQALALLSSLLSDAAASVRFQAAFAMGKLGPLGADQIDAIRSVVEREPDPQVRDQLRGFVESLESQGR